MNGMWETKHIIVEISYCILLKLQMNLKINCIILKADTKMNTPGITRIIASYKYYICGNSTVNKRLSKVDWQVIYDFTSTRKTKCE